jgi:hypothetical protein
MQKYPFMPLVSPKEVRGSLPGLDTNIDRENNEDNKE